MAEASSASSSFSEIPPRELQPPGEQMRMFHKIISSGLTIKTQQRGEPELSEQEKLDALAGTLQTQPGAFLMRFGSVLDDSDLTFFSGSSDYEVQFRVKELRKQLVPAYRERRVRNRRYECLKELMGTDYFSEEEMRQRNPLLFKYYIGQYMSEEELAALDSTTSEMRLSSHIMKKMRQDERRERERWQNEKERAQEEEEDTSSEEEEEEAMEGESAEVTDTERWRLRQEFLQAMQLSFLRGEDKEFDYGRIDRDEQYDSIETQQQDGEDAYFDEEEPERCTDEADTQLATLEEDSPDSPQR